MTQDLDSLGNTVYAWFVRIYKRLNDDQTRFVHPYGVTPSQYGVMAVLMQEDGLTFTELGRRTVLHGSTLTGIVDRLEGKGLVARVNDVHDRRQIQVGITDKGKDLFRRIPTIDTNGLLCNVLKGLSDDDQEVLVQLLSRIGREIGEERYDDLISHVNRIRRQSCGLLADSSQPDP